MYNEKFFKEQLSLTSQQAADYLIAFCRIYWVLRDNHYFDYPRKRYPDYGNIACQIVKKLYRVESQLQAFHLLEEILAAHIKLNKAIIDDLAKQVLSVRDVFIWPAEAYE